MIAFDSKWSTNILSLKNIFSLTLVLTFITLHYYFDSTLLMHLKLSRNNCGTSDIFKDILAKRLAFRYLIFSKLSNLNYSWVYDIVSKSMSFFWTLVISLTFHGKILKVQLVNDSWSLSIFSENSDQQLSPSQTYFFQSAVLDYACYIFSISILLVLEFAVTTVFTNMGILFFVS